MKKRWAALTLLLLLPVSVFAMGLLELPILKPKPLIPSPTVGVQPFKKAFPMILNQTATPAPETPQAQKTATPVPDRWESEARLYVAQAPEGAGLYASESLQRPLGRIPQGVYFWAQGALALQYAAYADLAAAEEIPCPSLAVYTATALCDIPLYKTPALDDPPLRFLPAGSRVAAVRDLENGVSALFGETPQFFKTEWVKGQE